MIHENKVKEIVRRNRRLNRNPSIERKALLLIEAYVMPDINWKSEQAMKDAIYRFAHVALCTCENPHKDWVKKLEDDFKKFHKMGMF